MITEWQERTLRKYSFHSLIRDYLTGSDFFPLRVGLRKISGRELAGNFSTYRSEFETTTRVCQNSSIEVVFSSFLHRTLGPQSLPVELLVPTREAYLRFIGKEQEFDLIQRAAERVLERLPGLRAFFVSHPARIAEYAYAWPQLVKVCQFLLASPNTGLYLRQLEIEDVDTKFIEGHKKIISQILHQLREIPGQGQAQHDSVGVDFFEERHGLQKESPRLRFRLLDQGLCSVFSGVDDLEIPVSSLKKLKIPCETVFILENKTTGLCLPPFKKTIVFFELGYKALLLREIEWLHRCRLVYWGDIDTHGYSILSQLRAHFPQLESVLMDQSTLLDHRNMWTREGSTYAGDCLNLTPDEFEVFDGLRLKSWGPHVRLEQERIRISKFSEAIASLDKSNDQK